MEFATDHGSRDQRKRESMFSTEDGPSRAAEHRCLRGSAHSLPNSLNNRRGTQARDDLPLVTVRVMSRYRSGKDDGRLSHSHDPCDSNRFHRDPLCYSKRLAKPNQRSEEEARTAILFVLEASCENSEISHGPA